MSSVPPWVHKPVKVTARRAEAILEIEWQDGHLSRYPYAGLRAACPCAECRTRGARPSEDPLLLPVLPVQSLELKQVEPVGNYAIQLIWKDGHRFGIYPWDYLWGLCPCEDHRSGRLT